MRTRTHRLFAFFSALVVLSRFTAFAQAPKPAAPAIVGEWQGRANSNSSQMQIHVSVKESGGKYTGSIETPHGAWSILSVDIKDDMWTVRFSRGDGGTDGTMKGKIAGKTFSGDWDNAPMAVGTFEVQKT